MATTRLRLNSDEHIAAGVRRIARGQLAVAHEGLDGHGDVGEGVHEARKSLKRVRAVVRLARDHLGDEVYRHENRLFRDTGRVLSGARDAEVLSETLDDLVHRCRDEIDDAAFAGLREVLVADAKAAGARIAGAATVVDAVRGNLDSARERVETWPLPEDADAEALAPGFERIYRRGRRARKAAGRDGGDEQLHELRKRAKDLWHAAQILRPVAPKAMKRLGRRAHRLSDLLGDDHDLAVLLEAARTGTAALRPGELELLTQLVERRRKGLQREALARAKRLYRRKPKSWKRRIARGAAAHA
jgi:CHAD domain-containing protein